MQVISDPKSVRSQELTHGLGSVLTIGAYDGVHLGHRAVIGEVRRIAEARGVKSAVVTFDRHPASVVRPESAPKLLTSLDQKLELLESTGVDIVVVVPFDHERATESAESFVMSVMVECLGVKAVVVGSDFHFGKDRRGNIDLLTAMGGEEGFDVLSLALIGGAGGTKVSSTAIRSFIRNGDMPSAAAMLGRPVELRGIVIDGDKRGRTIGFPTANVSVDDEICLPADGIYAAWYLRPDGIRRKAAVNLGRRPTFYDDQAYSLLEAFLIDFSGDLYEEAAVVEFVERLRPEAKFDSLDALLKQMGHDVENATLILDGLTSH